MKRISTGGAGTVPPMHHQLQTSGSDCCGTSQSAPGSIWDQIAVIHSETSAALNVLATLSPSQSARNVTLSPQGIVFAEPENLQFRGISFDGCDTSNPVLQRVNPFSDLPRTWSKLPSRSRALCPCAVLRRPLCVAADS